MSMTRVGNNAVPQQVAHAAPSKAAEGSGPFFDVDLGSAARPAARTALKDAVSSFFTKIAFGGSVAVGLLKEGLQRADQAVLQPIEKAMASAWKAVSSVPGRIADGFHALRAERPASGAGTAVQTAAAVAAPERAPTRTIGEMALAAHAVVLQQEATFQPGGGGSTLRGGELKESDEALRGMVDATFGPELQSFRDSLGGTELATFRGNPESVSASDALRTDSEIDASVDRFIDNMERLNDMIFGDGSDAAIRRTAERLPMDACTLVAARHDAVDQMNQTASFKTALKNLLSGQEGSLRTFGPLLVQGADRDSLQGLNAIAVTTFFQHCTKAEAAQGELPKATQAGVIPDSRRPQLEALATRTHDNLMRLGAAMAERGHAAFQALSLENLMATEEMSSFVR